mgnify:CR=1 FL=1
MIEKKKKVVFYESEYMYANFKIRLAYDKIRQGDFFRFLIEEYINNNKHILMAVEEYKIKSKKMGKQKILNTAREFEESNCLLDDLGITKIDRDRIFDIIEKGDEE